MLLLTNCKMQQDTGHAKAFPDASADRASVTYILQTGAVFVLVEVVALPEAQQVVEVIKQAARIFLSVLLLT